MNKKDPQSQRFARLILGQVHEVDNYQITLAHNFSAAARRKLGLECRNSSRLAFKHNKQADWDERPGDADPAAMRRDEHN